MGSNDISPLVNPLHPSVVDRLDPVFTEIYNKYQASQLRADQVPYEVYNADRAKYTFPTAKVAGPAPATLSSEIFHVRVKDPRGQIAVQVYVPTPEAVAEAKSSRDGLLLALVNFHGGGFVIGGLESDEPLCRKLCQRVGCVVVNVAYRLAPEHQHPVPANDGYAALRWVFALTTPACSASTPRAAALTARKEQLTPPLALQLLIVPVLDARHVPTAGSCDPAKTPYRSYVEFEHAPMLPLARLVWFYNLWLGDDWGHPIIACDYRASPVGAPSHADLPPALIYCAEIDPLRDEAAAYHDKLRAAGVPSELKVYAGQGHPFNQWDGESPAAREFVEDCIAGLKNAFAVRASS
ncbi:alpha/beta hydrolase fold protein [Hypoxylon sp. FL1284]|nr:alpha/beta hydrolase fold protein [Hypoxylon sp. FL1284]